MKKVTLIYISILALLFTACSSVTRVACVGDSITFGYGLLNDNSYPVELSKNLGAKYSVLNFGMSGTTLQKETDFSYWKCKEFTNVFAERPNIIIVKLGTNDTKKAFWNAEHFATDYQLLIDSLKTIPGNPRIYVCLPVPVYKNKFNISETIMTTGVIPTVEQIAKRNKLTIIDLYHPLSNQAENFPDGVHPNEKAAKMMADIISAAIKK
jgi:acyl-CoA thioesterase-1